MKWNDDWRKELSKLYPDCYDRLCECRNIKSDILIIVRFMMWYNKDRKNYEVVNRVIDWLTDWNGQTELIPTQDEYNELLSITCRRAVK